MPSRTVRTMSTDPKPRRRRAKAEPAAEYGEAGDLTFVKEEPANAARSSGTGPSLVPNLLRAMREEPGEFVRIVAYDKKSTATGTADGLRKGRRGIPEGRWEIRTSKIPNDGRFGVYAKYLGPEEKARNPE